MPNTTSATLAFNRGVLSQLGLARIDLTRYRMAAAGMTNWMARVLGSMTLRSGWGYFGNSAGNNRARTIPFIFGATDTARLEVTQGVTRVWVNDVLITRNAVGTVVTNGSFVASLAGWTNSSEAGAVASWAGNGQASLVGTGSNNAILDQQVNVALADQSKRQALRIIVTSGPITFRCGTSQGDDSLINETVLFTGTHSLALTPGAASFWIRFENANHAASILNSCNIEPVGILTLPTPWQTDTNLLRLRWAQSADVIFVGCSGYPQQRFERRAVDSWSIVDYTQMCTLGPFRPINVTNVTIAPSAINGNITLTANKPLFKPGQVGALYRIISAGQLVQSILGAANTFTDPILVTGVGAQRTFNISLGAGYVGIISLQYSVGTSAGPWVDTGQTWNVPVSTNFNDGNNNDTIYYRLGFKAGNYTSGSTLAALSISQGTITGIARVTGYTDNMHVNAAVIKDMGGTDATSNWFEGSWSTFRGYPATPNLWGGRLWWFGTSIFGSVSDDYINFDDTVIGDSAPIIGQFDEGPVENVYWAVGLQQLVCGLASAEPSLRSTYLGDPVTPNNFNVMTGSTQGSANVNALVMDRTGVFVQASGQRVFTLDLDVYTYSYKSNELTLLVPDFNKAGIVMIAIQRKPDTRIHCLRADGTVGVMVYDQSENVTCWLDAAPARSAAGPGFVEDISVLPGVDQTEDNVYYVVRRVINGQTVRFHEKWAFETECTGFQVAKLSDAFTTWQAPDGITTTFNLPQNIQTDSGLNLQTDSGIQLVTQPLVGNLVLLTDSGDQLTTDDDQQILLGSGGSGTAVPGTLNIPNAVPWLAGESVCVWGWNTVVPFVDGNGNQPGLDLGLYVVDASGSISGLTLDGQPYPITNAVIGLPYTAQWESMKESFAAALGTPLNQPKRIPQLGLILKNTHAMGIKVGNDFDHLDDLPQDDLPKLSDGMPDKNSILTDYDQQMSAFNAVWSTDSRVCIQAASPRPCTVLAFTTEMDTSG